MAQLLQIHPDNPQPRLIRRAVEIIQQGAVIVYPTDSLYALGCQLGDKTAQERIRRLRQLSPQHHFTLVCRDLSQLSVYARVDTPTFRLLKAHTPGPYTFILPATSEVPRRLQHPRRKTIGLRIPENAIAQALLTELGQPLMSVTLLLPDEALLLRDAAAINERLGSQVELIIDGGASGIELTTLVDLVSGTPQVLRQGKGDTRAFMT